jgi:cell division protein FtsA
MKKNTVIAAIDIGTAKIATLIAIMEEGGSLRVVGASAVQSQGVKKSQIVNLEETTAALTASVDAAERMAGFSINQAFVSVGGRHIESQNSRGVVAISDPNGDIVPDDVNRVMEAARAISLPANREIIHVLPTSYKVDSQDGIKDPIGMSGVRLEVQAHIITASTTVLRNIRKCVEQLGIQVAGFVYAGLAASLATVNETERDLGAVVIDIGAGSSALSVYVEGSMVASTVIPIGSMHITKDIALGAHITMMGAEQVKVALSQLMASGTAATADESREAARKRRQTEDQIDLQQLGLNEETRYLSKKRLVEVFIASRVNELFEMVQKFLEDTKLLRDVPSGIVLTGGGAETVGMSEGARRILGLTTRVGRPTGLRGLIDEIESPVYATTVGLLLFGKTSDVVTTVSSGGFSLKSVGKNLAPHRIVELIQKLWHSIMP